ncbi:MAG: hypothetical protein Q8M91_18445 [Polaromonas sp.]|nr:hypothetical protein [Polaromonas sp.]MDP3172314.1 hypothetical protein [Polaromonas sp.]MDP3412945.1 hypothetical protein [Polaromonas sp.]MDP3604298.1 hypothetical protein [Polaromonas sp.]
MTLIQPAFSAVMVLNIVWFGMAFYFFSVRPVTVAKLLVPRGERDSLLFGTVMYALRFLGGMNFALALLSLVLLVNPVGFTPVQQGWLALVLAVAHASQCSFNMPLVLNQRGMPGATRLGLSRPLRMIFAVDCVMTVANTALWLMLWQVAPH